MEDKRYVLWHSKRVAQRWIVLFRDTYHWKQKTIWHIYPTPNNHFMWWPRFHTTIRIGPLGFVRHNSGIELRCWKFNLVFHW